MLPRACRAVVTGAGGGLGRAFVHELARRGARILAADIDLEAANASVAGLAGVEAHPLRCDVARAEEVEAMAAEADRRFGGVDLVINNAGVAAAGRVGEIKLEDWQWLMGVNLWGVIHGCHSFVPRFRKQGSGHILNVASAAAMASMPLMAPYNVSKAAVVSLSETLHAELSEVGIGVTVLCPTFFQTNIAKSGRASAEMNAMAESLMRRSKLDAGGVARIALDSVDAGRLYVLPHLDGRVVWGMKRLMPETFAGLAPRLLKKQVARLGHKLAL